MRYQLTDHEWVAIKPMLPNKPRGVGNFLSPSLMRAGTGRPTRWAYSLLAGFDSTADIMRATVASLARYFLEGASVSSPAMKSSRSCWAVDLSTWIERRDYALLLTMLWDLRVAIMTELRDQELTETG